MVSPLTVPTIRTLTPVMLSAIVGAVVSLVFRFVPGAKDWFDSLASEHKQLFMLGVTVAVSAVIAAYTYFQEGVTGDSFIGLLLTIYAALTSNQVTYQFIKPGNHANV